MKQYLLKLTCLSIISLLSAPGCQQDQSAPIENTTSPARAEKPSETGSATDEQETSTNEAATKPVADTPQLTLDDIFSRDHVIDVQITVAQKDWDTIRFQSRNIMTALQPQRQFEPIDGPYTYVNAKVTIDGVEFPNVGIRKKGFIGSQSSTRPSLKIKLDYVNKEENIEGLETLTFNNNQQDISHMSQFMSYAFFNAVGSPASRCALAKVTVNGTNLGIYSHVESVRKHLFKREFGSDKGTLYEGTVVDFFPDWEGSFENKFGKDKKARKKIVELINVLEGKEGSKILASDAPGRAWVPVNNPGQGDETLAAYPDADSNNSTSLKEATARINAIKKVLSTPTAALAESQAKWEKEAVQNRIAMTSWSLTGPFMVESFDQAYTQVLPPEKKVDLKGSYDWGDNTLTWVNPRKLVDGQPFVLGGQPNAARYFYRTITSLTARTLPISLGSDDAVKVWLNGTLQFENKVQRGIEDERDKIELKLNAGENQLLIKIVNGFGQSGFFFEAQEETLPADLLAAIRVPKAERNDDQKQIVDNYFFGIAPELQSARDQLSAVTREYYQRWTQIDFNDSNWTEGKNGAGLELQQGYQDLIDPAFNFAESMHQKNASLYLRFPFEIPDLGQVSEKGALNLRVKYDDGFVAFLNGKQVASANAPANPRWNSQATRGHDDPAAMQFEIFDISEFRDQLQQGKNVLAIHAMNVNPQSTDMLLVAEIETNDFNYEEAIGELVDLDAFYKFWAVEGLLGFWDGYSGNRNNFFVYLNPETDKFHFLPWGADALFEKFSKLRVDRRAPVSVKTMGRIAHRLYQIPSARERYARTMQALLDEHWDEKKLMAEVDRAQAMIEPHLTPAQKRALPRGEIRRFIPTRRADILKEISGDMPLWSNAPGPPPVIGGPRRNDGGNLWTASRQGKLGIVKRQLAKQDINSRDKEGSTALHQAALGAQQEIVAFLLEKGANINAADKAGNTALHTAAFLGELEIVQLLVEKGANVNLGNNQRETPLAVSAGPWNEEIQGLVQFLTATLDLKIDQDRMKAGRTKVAEFLRSQGAKSVGDAPKRSTTGRGENSRADLWTAAKTGDLAALERHVSQKTDLNAQDQRMGLTPLALASLGGHVEAAKLIISKGGEVNAKNRDGSVPLHGAAFLGRVEIVKLLLENEANLNAKNAMGETPLDSASQPWNAQIQGIVQFVSTILQIKVDVNAVKAGRPRVVELLQQHSEKTKAPADDSK